MATLKEKLAELLAKCSYSQRRDYLQTFSSPPGNYMLWPLLRVRDMRPLLYNADRTLNLDLLQNIGASKLEALLKVLRTNEHRQVQNALTKL